MKTFACAVSAVVLGVLAFAGSGQAAPKDVVKPEAAQLSPRFSWSTVVNNTDFMPTRGCEEDDTKCRLFNSYNQPSVNERGLVVIRARSRGGQDETGGHREEHEVGVTLNNADDGSDVGSGGGSGTEHGNQPVHGIYTRDMSVADSPVVRILDRKTEVPAPNNAHYPPSNPLLTTFIETPSFPRIDSRSDTIATRGNHQPVWVYEVGIDPDTGEPLETRAGTTGIYTNPFGDLITGVSKLGAVPGFEFFAVPGLEVPTAFDVFPGAPAVTGGNTIVFKGNFTVDNVGRTGVFYRELQDAPIVLAEGPELAPAAGMSDGVLIANNVQTVIPGTNPPVVFGSTAPPSAAKGQVVFAGFDNEELPTLGGLYLAPLAPTPDLTTLVSIGGQVPGESAPATFNGLGEGVAFDGRFVGFWGAWGEETRTVRLYCSTEGNKDRIDYCNQALVCEDTGQTIGDPDSICDDESDPNYGQRCYQEKQVPLHQGVFVHDTNTGKTLAVAKAGNGFDEFLFWNYSGKTPCAGGGHSEEGAEDDGEAARWRSSSFVAVSNRGSGAAFSTAFKARKGELVDGVYANPVDGIYLSKWPGKGQDIVTVLDTTMNGQIVDPEAPAGSIITELGIEREGLRGHWLTINASMGVEGGSEEEGMSGVYLKRVR